MVAQEVTVTEVALAVGSVNREVVDMAAEVTDTAEAQGAWAWLVDFPLVRLVD